MWITYRKNFAPLLIEKKNVGPKLTSDGGWGCVIRCTQMLIANVLRQSILSKGNLTSSAQTNKNIEILSLFDDDKRNCTENPFSIQNVVEMAHTMHKQLPGEWYGVTKINEIFCQINDTFNLSQKPPLAGFKMIEFKNGELILQDILKEGIGQAKYDNLHESNVPVNFSMVSE